MDSSPVAVNARTNTDHSDERAAVSAEPALVEQRLNSLALEIEASALLTDSPLINAKFLEPRTVNAPQSFIQQEEDQFYSKGVLIRNETGAIEGILVEGFLETPENGLTSHVALYRFGWPEGSMREVIYDDLQESFKQLSSKETYFDGIKQLQEAVDHGFIYQIHPNFIDPKQFPEIADKLEGPDGKDALVHLLNHFEIDHSQWGNGSKSLEHLLHELQTGESKLGRDENGLFIATTAARVNVFHQKEDGTLLKLEEDFQRVQPVNEPETTIVRDLSITLGEKMLPFETGKEAALRGILEELGIDDAKLINNTGSLSASAQKSGTYPGLPHKGFYWNFDVVFNGDQYKENRPHPTEKDKDGESTLIYAYQEKGEGKKVFFKWRAVAENEQPLSAMGIPIRDLIAEELRAENLAHSEKNENHQAA